MKTILIIFSFIFSIATNAQTKEKLKYKFFVDSAHFHFQQENYEKSIYFCTEAIHTIPDVPFAYGLRGICYLRQERYLEAIHDYTRAIDSEIELKIGDLYYSRAICEINVCDTNGCLSDLNKAIDQDIKNPDAYFMRAQILESKNMTSRALLDLSQCLSIDSTYYNALVLKAELLSKKEDFKEAYVLYKKAVSIDPSDAYLHYKMGLIKLNSYNEKASLKHFNETLKRDSIKFSDVYLLRGNVYREMGEDEKALIDFEKYVSYFPDDAIGYYAVARAKIRLKMQVEALPDLNKSIELNDQDGEVYYWRGLVKFWLEMDGCSDLIKADEFGYYDAKLEIKNRSCRK